MDPKEIFLIICIPLSILLTITLIKIFNKATNAGRISKTQRIFGIIVTILSPINGFIISRFIKKK